MNVSDYRSTLRAAAKDLARARRVLVITGAGLSADSGLPTYRGVSGLYENTDTEDGMAIETALSGTMLRRRPDITWKYLLQIARACHGKAPNAAHHALVAMATRFAAFTVLTQNVDGLHRRAGQTDLIEIHGNFARLYCTVCGYETHGVDAAQLHATPACPCCASSLRPDVVLFGEALPEAALQRLHAVLAAGVDCVLSVGTSSVFPYIAQPVVQAARQGLPTIEINPERTEVSYLVRHRLAMRAAVALPALWDYLQPGACSAPEPAY